MCALVCFVFVCVCCLGVVGVRVLCYDGRGTVMMVYGDVCGERPVAGGKVWWQRLRMR
jgi:hypothetical protein